MHTKSTKQDIIRQNYLYKKYSENLLHTASTQDICMQKCLHSILYIKTKLLDISRKNYISMILYMLTSICKGCTGMQTKFFTQDVCRLKVVRYTHTKLSIINDETVYVVYLQTKLHKINFYIKHIYVCPYLIM